MTWRNASPTATADISFSLCSDILATCYLGQQRTNQLSLGSRNYEYDETFGFELLCDSMSTAELQRSLFETVGLLPLLLTDFELAEVKQIYLLFLSLIERQNYYQQHSTN